MQEPSEQEQQEQSQEQSQDQPQDQPHQQTDGSDQGAPSPYPLATRMQRLAAAILDDFIALLLLLPVFGYYDVFRYMETEGGIPMNLIININIYAFVFFLLVHGYLLYNYGQTIGKRVMGIAISTMDYQVPSFNRMIALRYVPFRIAGLIPGLNVLPLVSVLFIFRQDKRCLHDLLADTQVIYVGAAGNS